MRTRQLKELAVQFLAKTSLVPLTFMSLLLSLSVQAAPSAILPLESSDRDMPQLEEALRDPTVTASGIHDEADAEQQRASIKQKEAEIRGARGNRTLELQAAIFEVYAALAYFYADQIASHPEMRGKLMESRAAVNQYARILARNSKTPWAKARYTYHVAVGQLISGTGRYAAAQTISQVEKSLPKNLMNGAKIITALYQLSKGGNEKQKGEATLRIAANRTSPSAAIALFLTIAKNSSKKDYRSALNAASSRAARLSPEEKAQFMSQACAIWQKQEGRSIDWNQPPFNMQRFSDTSQVRAIQERAALQDLGHGQNERAIKRYRILAKSFEGTLQYRAIESRVLDLLQDSSQKTKSYRSLEAEILAVENRLKDGAILGSGNESQAQAFASQVSQRHMQLADRVFALGNSGRSSSEERRVSVIILQNYVNSLSDNDSRRDIYKERIGQLYAVNNDHAKAVAVYLDLALNGKDPSKKSHYYNQAINSQRILAHWSAEAPWLVATAAASKASRESLLDMYGKLYEVAPQRWDLAAHMGLLQISLNQTQAAFDLWTAQLAKTTSGIHAAQAVGYMLSSYERGAKWEQLESLSRVAIKGNMRPLFRRQSIQPQVTLGLALLEGGKKLTGDQQFALAVKKLDEFVMQYRSHNRRDEAMLFLAEALKGAGNHQRSIEMLMALNEQYPQSKYLRTALLRGGEAAVASAFEDTAIFFDEAFVKRFAKDRETEKVRDQLIALLTGRELYARAEEHLKQRFYSRHLSKAVTSQAAIDWLELEEHQGSPAKAAQIADLILAANLSDTAARANAVQVKAKAAYLKRDLGNLNSLLRLATTFDQTQIEAVEAQGQLRFLIAELRASNMSFDSDPLASADPLAELNRNYSIFWESKTVYESVCNAGQSSFCAPAMYRLARLSENTVEWLQDLKIAGTLDAQVVKNFQNRKQAIMDGLATLVETSDSKALAVTAEGHNSPDWTDEILWQNTSDWNFDRLSGNGGKGAVQWKAQFTSMKRE